MTFSIFRVLTCVLAAGAFLAQFTAVAADENVTVERLTWAGVKIVAGETTVFVDAVGTDLWQGNAPGGLAPVTADTRRRYALITHTHNDHFDVETLKEVLGERGYVICHESIAAYVASRGLKVIPAKMFHPVSRGGFWFTAVPADDGFGDKQVSWVISTGDNTFFHGGDTLWHGQFEKIGAVYGPFDMAFLPINGARVARHPVVETPAVLSPAEAVDAANLLRAKSTVPIHFGLSGDENYVEARNPLRQFEENAKRREIVVKPMKPGEKVQISN